MQLLLNLSRQPDQHTHDYAYEYLNPEPATGSTPDQMLYRQIMAEPFEGEHWGPGHDEEIVDGWTDSEDDGESEGDSPEEQEVLTPSTTRVRTMSKEPTEERGGASEQRLMEAKRRLDSLRRQAYWHPENQVPMPTFNEGLYGWRDLTTSECPINHHNQSQAERINSEGFVGSLPFSGTSPNGAQAPQVVSDQFRQTISTDSLAGHLSARSSARTHLCPLWQTRLHIPVSRCSRLVAERGSSSSSIPLLPGVVRDTRGLRRSGQSSFGHSIIHQGYSHSNFLILDRADKAVQDDRGLCRGLPRLHAGV